MYIDNNNPQNCNVCEKRNHCPNCVGDCVECSKKIICANCRALCAVCEQFHYCNNNRKTIKRKNM